jgi:hypothetical protein
MGPTLAFDMRSMEHHTVSRRGCGCAALTAMPVTL